MLNKDKLKVEAELDRVSSMTVFTHLNVIGKMKKIGKEESKVLSRKSRNDNSIFE